MDISRSAPAEPVHLAPTPSILRSGSRRAQIFGSDLHEHRRPTVSSRGMGIGTTTTSPRDGRSQQPVLQRRQVTMNRLIYQLSYQFTGSERYRVEEETHKHWYPHVARGIPSAPLTWPEEFNHVGRLQPRKTTHYHKRKSTVSRDEDAAQQKSEFTHTLPCSIRTTSKQRFDCQKHNLNNNTHKTCAKSPSPSPLRRRATCSTRTSTVHPAYTSRALNQTELITTQLE